MRKQIMIIAICVVFFVNFIDVINADDFVPTWLKKDTYVKYTIDQVGYAHIVNSSNPDIFDILSFWNATFGWRCISINSTMAKIIFTFEYTGKELNGNSLDNTASQFSGEVYVDLLTRIVYDHEWDLLGTTHFWLPANPVEGQEMIVWDIPPDRLSLPTKCKDVWFLTTQGKQDGFLVEGTHEINNITRNFLILCDYDTGIMVDGSFAWDPLINSAGIDALFLNDRVLLSDTNIPQAYPHAPHSHDEDDHDSPDWGLVMFVVFPIATFIILFATFYKLLSKKQKKHTNTHQPNTKSYTKYLRNLNKWAIIHRQIAFKKTINTVFHLNKSKQKPFSIGDL